MTYWGVWTVNTDPVFLKRNGGVSDMLLAIEKDEHHAHWIAHRLVEMYRDTNIFVQEV